MHPPSTAPLERTSAGARGSGAAPATSPRMGPSLAEVTAGTSARYSGITYTRAPPPKYVEIAPLNELDRTLSPRERPSHAHEAQNFREPPTKADQQGRESSFENLNTTQLPESERTRPSAANTRLANAPTGEAAVKSMIERISARQSGAVKAARASDSHTTHHSHRIPSSSTPHQHRTPSYSSTARPPSPPKPSWNSSTHMDHDHDDAGLYVHESPLQAGRPTSTSRPKSRHHHQRREESRAKEEEARNHPSTQDVFPASDPHPGAHMHPSAAMLRKLD